MTYKTKNLQTQEILNTYFSYVANASCTIETNNTKSRLHMFYH